MDSGRRCDVTKYVFVKVDTWAMFEGYGYDSLLMSSGAVRDRLQDYSDNLLDQVKWSRDTDREKKRPIIFICHSMGGLVARLAMTRLHTLPTKFPFLDSNNVGSYI
jgi:hypothetical protein